MKARFIAVLLSFFVVSQPLYAVPAAPTAKLLAANHPINLNKASASELTGSFKGIGKKKAESIIAYRESHQGFKSVEELAEVKGLGQRFMENNREQLNKRFVVQ